MSIDNFNILNKDELEYITNSSYIDDYPGLLKAINEPRFTIKELCVAARDATYWDKKGILPELKGTNTTRRKYTLKQAVWIKLIQQLRSFDVSLNQINKIKSDIIKTGPSIRELIQSEDINKVVEVLAQKGGNLEAYKNLIKDPAFLEQMESQHIDMFEVIIIYAIIFRRDISYIVTVDGYCVPYVFDKHEQIKKAYPEFETIMKSPHIVLSISQAYSQLIQEWNEKSWFNEISIVSKDEKKVLKLMREDSTKELRIIKNGSELDRVILVKDKPISGIEEFANHIVRNGYQTITISTRQGKAVHFKNEVSIKLKNVPD
jgi:DNA-binding transcriptional MerR regulator